MRTPIISWRLVTANSLVIAGAVAIGQYAPTLWWVAGLTMVLSAINLALWRSEMRAVESAVESRVRREIEENSRRRIYLDGLFNRDVQ